MDEGDALIVEVKSFNPELQVNAKVGSGAVGNGRSIGS
jgi:hypothetical protein